MFCLALNISELWADGVFQEYFWKVVNVIIVILIMLVTVKIVRGFFKRAIKKIGENKTKKTHLVMVRSIVTVAVYVIFIAVVLSQFDALRNIGVSLLAGSGIAVLGISLAAQDLLSNIIGGIAISVYQPFKVGDTIKYIATGTIGVIEDINLRHTIMRTADNRRIIIPNSAVNQDVIESYSFGDERFCLFTEFGISYDADIDAAIKIIIDKTIAHPDYLDVRTEAEIAAGAESVKVRVIRLDDSSVVLRLWLWAKDFGTCCGMQWDLLKSVKEEFDSKGIEIPYKYINIIDRSKEQK